MSTFPRPRARWRSGPMRRGEERWHPRGPGRPELRLRGRSRRDGACPRGARAPPAAAAAPRPPGAPAALASPPCPAPLQAAARPPVPAGRRRSGNLRPGLLLSFGALVCFLTCCNAASIFPPALSKTAAEIPHLGGNRMCTPPEPAQL